MLSHVQEWEAPPHCLVLTSCPQPWQPAKNTACPLNLECRKVEPPDSYLFLALPPSSSFHPDPPHLTRPFCLCPPQQLWERAGWSLGICEQAGLEEPLGFGSPWAARAGGRRGRQRGQSNSLTSEERGTEGFGLWFVGLCFLNLSFFFLKKKKPPSCVIIFMGSAILAKICL